jgi:hypothetical protein
MCRVGEPGSASAQREGAQGSSRPGAHGEKGAERRQPRQHGTPAPRRMGLHSQGRHAAAPGCRHQPDAPYATCSCWGGGVREEQQSGASGPGEEPSRAPHAPPGLCRVGGVDEDGQAQRERLEALRLQQERPLDCHAAAADGLEGRAPPRGVCGRGGGAHARAGGAVAAGGGAGGSSGGPSNPQRAAAMRTRSHGAPARPRPAPASLRPAPPRSAPLHPPRSTSTPVAPGMGGHIALIKPCGSIRRNTSGVAVL